MKYMGGKTRIAKFIVPIIQKFIDDSGCKFYIEPFVGGANVIDKIQCEFRIGNDINPYLIALFKNLDKLETLPETISREEYSKVRECYNKKLSTFSDWYIGAVGFLSSYNGRFFDDGYSGVITTKENTIRDYFDEAKRNLIAQRENLGRICWESMDYRELFIGSDALVYCDIPYKGVKQYSTSKNFNHNVFWEWAKEKSKTNIVLISESCAPDDFECIWEQPILRTVDNTKRVETTEKLFIWKGCKY